MPLAASVNFQITGTENYTGPGPGETGTAKIEKILKATYANANLMYSSKAVLKATGAVVTFETWTGNASTSTAAAGTKQVETFTALGNITSAGNLAVTVTGAGIAGSPLAVAVAVALNDTPAQWGTKVRNALLATAAVTALYDVSGTNAVTILTRKTESANDGTLQVAAAVGTAANASLPINSANTTGGVAAAGTVLSGTTDGEIRGVPIDPVINLYLVALVTGAAGVTVAGPITGVVPPNGFLILGAQAGGDISGDWLDTNLVVTSDGGAGTVDLVVFGLVSP